jgi:HD-like signal output (HDOD) protein/ActR/RegA family two-component response regulator
MSMTRVLFVDDEPLVLRAMQRVLRTLRENFEASFAGSGEEALKLLAEGHFDVLISDMRMPGMDGAALLAHAQKRFPATARVILSGYSQYEAALRALPVAHRFLSKPFRNEDIQTLLLRTVALHKMLGNPRLRELVGGAKDLPARPKVYFELRVALGDALAPVDKIARIIERDVGITGRLLRAVNNAFFAAPARITSVGAAVKYLGTDTLSGLVLSLECFGNFEDALADCELLPASLERQAYLAASIATELVSDETQQHDAFLAALLHDCGLLLMVERQPALVREAQALAKLDDCSLQDAERKLWGTSHAEVGAYLLGLWGLPYPVVEAVAWHHAQGQQTCEGMDVCVAVYIATAFAEAAMSGDIASVTLDEELLRRAGLLGKLPELMSIVERTISRNEAPASDSDEPSVPVH